MLIATVAFLLSFVAVYLANNSAGQVERKGEISMKALTEELKNRLIVINQNFEQLEQRVAKLEQMNQQDIAAQQSTMRKLANLQSDVDQLHKKQQSLENQRDGGR